MVAGTYLLEVTPPPSTGLTKIWTCSNFGEGGQINTSTGLDFGKGPTGLTVTCPTTGEDLFLGKFRSPGYGSWSRTSMNKISWTVLTERFDDDGHHLGFERLQGVSSMSPSGQITGTLKMEYFDDGSDPISGTPTCTFTGMAYTARRIPLLRHATLE